MDKKCQHLKGWRIKHTKKGVYRICRVRSCKLKILMMPDGSGGKSHIDEYHNIKTRRPKGKHKSTFEREQG